MKTIAIRLSDDEYSALCKKAETAQAANLSSFIRKALELPSTRRGIRRLGIPTPALFAGAPRQRRAAPGTRM